MNDSQFANVDIKLLEILEKHPDYFLKISREASHLYSIWDVNEMARIAYGDTVEDLIEDYYSYL